MNSLLCNWLKDWGDSIRSGLGDTWMIVLLVVFTAIAFALMYSIFKASVGKTKFVIKWGQIILLIIFALFIVWFIIILS